MRITLRKTSDTEHELEIRGEVTRCESKSLLRHDFLHYAVEAEAGLEHGFWGRLARGRTLADMNDRSGVAMQTDPDGGSELMAIERLVGALDSAAKGARAEAVVANVRRFDEASAVATPDWLTVDLVMRVQERMRRLLGQWKATPFGRSMELTWPPDQS